MRFGSHAVEIFAATMLAADKGRKWLSTMSWGKERPEIAIFQNIPQQCPGGKSDTAVCHFQSFLAVQNSSIGDLVTQSLRVPFTFEIQRATLETFDL